MKSLLLQFQAEDIQTIESFSGRCLLAHDMGLGKTRISLEWIKQHPEAQPAIVVCPSSVKYHWEREASIIGMKAEVLEGTSPRNIGARPRIIILNYDILDPWVDRLRKMNPMTIVLDECQYIKSRKAQRTKATKKLCQGVPHILALSGTPLVNRPVELWPTLNILQPSYFRSWWEFAKEFCDLKRGYWGWQYKGATNTAMLNRILLQQGMIRRKKVDVLKDLPPKIREVIPIPMDCPEEYASAKDDFLGWLAERDEEKAERASKAEAMVKLTTLKQLAAKLKMRYVVEWINNFLETTDEKLVVFTYHRKATDVIKRRCNTKSVIIDGSVTGRNRQSMVDQFQNDNDTRLLIGNMQAAGVGITLTAANTVVFAELDWRPGMHTQAEDRSYRIGTTKTVWVYYLVARFTIEEYLCDIIQQKQKVLSGVLDGGKVEGDLDVFSQLQKRLKEETL